MTNGKTFLKNFTLSGAKTHYAPNLQLEPKHMEIRLAFDIPKKIVKGSNTITVVSNVNNAKSIALNAVDFDKIEVEIDSGKWEYDGELINITWDSAIPKGTEKKIKINYLVQEPVGGLYFSYPDDYYPDRPIYVGSDHETERARYWLPCLDLPAIRTTLDWYLTAKTEYIILASGKEMNTIENNDGTKTTHWHHNFPCPSYIAAIAIGNFTEFKDRNTEAGKGLIPVAYYADKSFEPEDLQRSFGKTPEMIEWFVNKFKVPMEWSKYYQFALRGFRGAMENQTLVSWNDQSVFDESVQPERQFQIDTINLHEMAHVYFGDQVVVQDFGHAWLKESWATYISAIWLQDTYGEDEFRFDMYLNAKSYANEADNRYIRPIVTRTFNSSWQLFDRHLYPGGACRLHMLRMKLGDEIFWNAVKDYLSTFNGKVVETSDFVRKLKDHSGKNLDKFFDQWIYEEKGYPKFKVDFTYDSTKNEGKFKIEQTQVKDDKSEVKYTPFEFDLEIAWMLKGEDNYNIKTIKINEKFHTLIIPLDSEPDHVRIDPHGKILHQLELKTNDKFLIAQLKALDVVGRIQAAYTLSKSGKKKSIYAIKDVYENENFWGVRREMVLAVGKSKSRYAIDVLIHFMKVEKHPRIHRLIAEESGKFRDERIENELKVFLNQDIGPHAKTATLIALGKQRSANLKEIILPYLDDDGWQHIVRSGAYTALAELRMKELLPLIASKVDYGKESEFARLSAISAYAKLAAWFGKKERSEAIEKLMILTRDSYDHARFAAARGLATLKAKESIGSLEAMKALHPYQEVISIIKIIKSIRKSSKPGKEVTELKTELEKLTEKIQKMEVRIQELEAKYNS